MPDAARIVRQWLETDAAFGVGEVPMRARRAAAPVTASVAAAPKTIAGARAAVVAALAPPAPPPSAARALPPRTAPAPAASSDMPPRRAPSEQDSFFGTDPAMARKKTTAAKIALPPAPAGRIPDLPPTTRQQKEAALAALLRECETSCASLLNDISTRVVFGEGDPDAEVMFVGEGPGAEEDRLGRPFVGRSGQLLDKMIAAMGYTRAAGKIEGIYIGNVVKLRCAEWNEDGSRLVDRPPTPEEAARGLPLLHKQIEIIRPRVIVTLGAPAVKYLTGTTQGVMSIRGTWLEYRGIPVMPTYHPAFVLRAYTPENRRKVWSDLQEALKRAKG